MKKFETRYEKYRKEHSRITNKQYKLDEEKLKKEVELNNYIKTHRSLKYDKIETKDVEKLKQIYKFFDDNYPVQWQGGLRCDERGMALVYWLYDDPDYLNFCLGSTSQNICFGGSTDWLVYAPTLQDKIAIIKQIKETVLKIINGGSK